MPAKPESRNMRPVALIKTVTSARNMPTNTTSARIMSAKPESRSMRPVVVNKTVTSARNMPTNT